MKGFDTMMAEHFKNDDFTAKELHKNLICFNEKMNKEVDEIHNCMLKASNVGEFSISTIRPTTNEIDEEIVTYLKNQGFKVTQTPVNENGVPVFVIYNKSDFIRYDISW